MEIDPTAAQSANVSVPNGPILPMVDVAPPMADVVEELAEPGSHHSLETGPILPIADVAPPMVDVVEEVAEPESHDAVENVEVSPLDDVATESPKLNQIFDAFEGWSDWLLEWFEDMVSLS